MECSVLFPIVCELLKLRQRTHSGKNEQLVAACLTTIFDEYAMLKPTLNATCKVTVFLQRVIRMLAEHIKEFYCLKLNFQKNIQKQINDFEKALSDVVRSLTSLRVDEYPPANEGTTRKIAEKKSRRLNYSKHIIQILKGWLEQNSHNPYPSENEKQVLSDQTGLNMTQINNWFINARRRLLPSISK